MEESQKKELKRIRQNKIRIFVIVIVVALLSGAVAFTYFYVTTEARLALREAKNVKLALDMLNIEYYGLGKSVYDPSKQDGLSANVEKQVADIVDHKGRIEIRSYNPGEHEILYLIYETDRYRVIYRSDAEGDGWKVEYLTTIFDYTDKK
ncbi:MAG: hypothetical protein ACI4SA_04465 [Lachnospiraceae bacterium]